MTTANEKLLKRTADNLEVMETEMKKHKYEIDNQAAGLVAESKKLQVQHDAFGNRCDLYDSTMQGLGKQVEKLGYDNKELTERVATLVDQVERYKVCEDVRFQMTVEKAIETITAKQEAKMLSKIGISVM
jgi:hypothetical protein